jgi:oligopeptide/dipeptide ABC transporter ATP-binding protein
MVCGRSSIRANGCSKVKMSFWSGTRTEKSDSDTLLLQVQDLVTSFQTHQGQVAAVRGVSFTIESGEIVGLVGESGCGKSVTARSIMGLVPVPPGRLQGRILLHGVDLVGMSKRALQRIRGEQIAMIFQDPMTSLDPLYSAGEQVAETLRFHRKMSYKKAARAVVELFELVGIPLAAKRVRSYPHQLSGGMRQRVMIAMAIACSPKLLIADEPTTALDVTIQAQILQLLRSLNAERGMAVLLVTHDLGVIAETSHRVMVMYAGRIVEHATAVGLFGCPLHPYTRGLLASMPSTTDRHARLRPIGGSPPDLSKPTCGCAFAIRCPLAHDRCRTELPLLRELRPGHWSACHVAEALLELSGGAPLTKAAS